MPSIADFLEHFTGERVTIFVWVQHQSQLFVVASSLLGVRGTHETHALEDDGLRGFTELEHQKDFLERQFFIVSLTFAKLSQIILGHLGSTRIDLLLHSLESYLAIVSHSISHMLLRKC